nr:hypothetical protein [uncultured Methanoregula sp.]
MTIYNRELTERIKTELTKRGALRPCSRCGKADFSLESEGMFVHLVQTDDHAMVIGGGTAIPTAIIICTNCGYVMEHALGTLGLLTVEKAITPTGDVTKSLQENKEAEK